MLGVRLAADSRSFLSCLELVFLHIVKKIPEPFSEEWAIGLISGIGYCFAILAVHWLSKHLEPVFCGRRGNWYVIVAVPLLVIIAVYDMASLGASNGIMVRTGATWDCIMIRFSVSWILVLTFCLWQRRILKCIWDDRIYLEQEKSGRYHAQIASL